MVTILLKLALAWVLVSAASLLILWLLLRDQFRARRDPPAPAVRQSQWRNGEQEWRKS